MYSRLAVTIGLVAALGLLPGTGRAADVDSPEIVNWAGPPVVGAEPPVDHQRLAYWNYDNNPPSSEVIAQPLVRFKDGTAVGCYSHLEHVDFVPDTPFSEWMLAKYFTILRASKRFPGFYWNLVPDVPPELTWQAGKTVIRIANCGETQKVGYVHLWQIPVGKYLLVGHTSKFRNASNLTMSHTLGPGPSGVGWYVSTTGGNYDEETDDYVTFAQLHVDAPNRIYTAPSFVVVAHWSQTGKK